MRRREFIAGLVGVAAWSRAVLAQSSEYKKVYSGDILPG